MQQQKKTGACHITLGYFLVVKKVIFYLLNAIFGSFFAILAHFID